MTRATSSTTVPVRSAPFLIIFVLSILVARLVSAQDFRVDDPPEAAPAQGASAIPPRTGFLSEPKIINSTLNFAIDKFGDNGTTKSGPYLEMSNMITGSGWVSLGPGYRQYLFDKRGFVDASAAASWHLYKMVQGRFEMTDVADHHVSAGIQGMWQDQTQVAYFGVGPDSLHDNETQYRMRNRDVVGYATYRPKVQGPVSFVGEVGYLWRPDIE